MKRRTHLAIEPLEGRALLSSLNDSVTTNQSTYQPGQAVVMTFQETNVSSQPVSVQEGPSIDGFNVSHNGSVIWRSNSGINPLFIALDTLQPGQSLTLSATWNGVPTGGTSPVSGTFEVVNQLNPTVTATFTMASSSSGPTTPTGPPAPQPPAGTPSPVSPDPGTDPPAPSPVASSSSSPVAVAIATDHSTYQVGHRVRMTMTVENTSHAPVDLASGSSGTGFTVLDGSTEVWHSGRLVAGRGARHLKPGQSVKVRAVWNGKAANPDVSIAPGTYSVVAIEGGHSSTTTVQITG